MATASTRNQAQNGTDFSSQKDISKNAKSNKQIKYYIKKVRIIINRIVTIVNWQMHKVELKRIWGLCIEPKTRMYMHVK